MSTANRRPKSKPKRKLPRQNDVRDIVDVDMAEIHPSPENDTLYKPVSPHDPAIQALACSIGDNGLQEPIVISMDDYIISGHRRYMACRLLKLKTVQCRRVNVCYFGDRDQFVKLLREHNRQRVKSLDEKIRETVIDANPDEARDELIEYRKNKSKVSHDPLSMGATKTRKRISEAKRQFETAIIEVVNDRKAYWPMSVRQIHYGLLNNPPLKHSGKPGSRYGNDPESYKSLVDLIGRMRLTGSILWSAIADDTRPVILWEVHAEPASFVTKEIGNFLKGYHRNLIQSQPNHIEVVVEKNTVANIVETVCGEFCIPQTSGRGFCSLPPRQEMAMRFKRSGKEQLIVLFVSDFDPEGEEIAASFARSMRDDFGISSIHPIKVALTAKQVDEYKLPPSMTAKEKSSRAKGFVEKYGENVWELEALPPATLQEIVRDEIVSVLDIDLFTAEQEAEKQDATQLLAIRLTVQEALLEVSFETDGDA